MLSGKTAIITGASRGIGRATAKLFSENGASVVITARDEELLKKTADEINAGSGGAKKCAYLPGDAEDLSVTERLYGRALEEFGGLDILVCSAGMVLREPTLDMPVSDWNRVMDVNLTAPMFLAQLCLKHFREQQGGKVVFVISGAGRHPHLGASPSYGASKAGLMYLTRHLAQEFARDHVYINSVCPGPVDTEITATWTPEHRARVFSNLPLGRLGRPIDIARPILFLASDMSDYITGECLAVNGGRNMD